MERVSRVLWCCIRHGRKILRLFPSVPHEYDAASRIQLGCNVAAVLELRS
jgi:hypothetical protein